MVPQSAQGQPAAIQCLVVVPTSFTILVFGRTCLLQTTDIKLLPCRGLNRFFQRRSVSECPLASPSLHCISRNRPFNVSTVRSRSSNCTIVAIISTPPPFA